MSPPQVTQDAALAVRVPVGKPLPQGFLWGVSTSSYQIEGAAELDGRGPNIWDVFSRAPGRIANSDTGDRACDHYQRYAEDIALMRQIGVRAAHDRYGPPIYVLENGSGAVETPDDSGQVIDQARIDYLALYIDAMREAVALGADVRGYFVWSLLDNFEWGAGYANRFGLVYVDYATQRRIPKASARWYADVIRAEAARLVR